jgi:hypothetical protein
LEYFAALPLRLEISCSSPRATKQDISDSVVLQGQSNMVHISLACDVCVLLVAFSQMQYPDNFSLFNSLWCHLPLQNTRSNYKFRSPHIIFVDLYGIRYYALI